MYAPIGNIGSLSQKQLLLSKSRSFGDLIQLDCAGQTIAEISLCIIHDYLTLWNDNLLY